MFILLIAIILLIGMVPQASSASNAEGNFTVNDETVQFTHAYALVGPNESLEHVKVIVARWDLYTLTQPDESPEDILIIVANMPLPKEIVEEAVEMGWWSLTDLSDIEGLKYLQLKVNAESGFGMAYYSVGSEQSNVGGLGKYELEALDDKSVKGRWHSEGEQNFYDTIYNFDVTFQAEIPPKSEVPPPTEEEMNAAAHSVQAAVYLEYIEAVKTGDVEELKKVLPIAMTPVLDGSHGKALIELTHMFTPPTVAFQRIMEQWGSATLTVSAQQEGQEMKGTIELTQEDDVWKVAKVRWE